MAKRSSNSLKRKRTYDQRQIDLLKITELLFTGNYTQRQMAEKINAGRPIEQQVSSAQIGRDVKKLRDEWAERRSDNLDYLMNRELARMDALEARLWEEIDRNVRVRSIEESASDGKGRDTKMVDKLAGNANAPLYARIESVQQDRRRLLGLYISTESRTINVQLKGYSVVSPDDWPEIEDGNTVDGQYQITDRKK